jgi:hypothetical protein
MGFQCFCDAIAMRLTRGSPHALNALFPNAEPFLKSTKKLLKFLATSYMDRSVSSKRRSKTFAAKDGGKWMQRIAGTLPHSGQLTTRWQPNGSENWLQRTECRS